MMRDDERRDDLDCQAMIDVATKAGALHRADWRTIRRFVEWCIARDAGVMVAQPMALYSPGEGDLTREDAR